MIGATSLWRLNVEATRLCNESQGDIVRASPWHTCCCLVRTRCFNSFFSAVLTTSECFGRLVCPRLGPDPLCPQQDAVSSGMFSHWSLLFLLLQSPCCHHGSPGLSCDCVPKEWTNYCDCLFNRLIWNKNCCHFVVASNILLSPPSRLSRSTVSKALDFKRVVHYGVATEYTCCPGTRKEPRGYTSGL